MSLRMNSRNASNRFHSRPLAGRPSLTRSASALKIDDQQHGHDELQNHELRNREARFPLVVVPQLAAEGLRDEDLAVELAVVLLDLLRRPLVAVCVVRRRRLSASSLTSSHCLAERLGLLDAGRVVRFGLARLLARRTCRGASCRWNQPGSAPLRGSGRTAWRSSRARAASGGTASISDSFGRHILSAPSISARPSYCRSASQSW